MDHFTSLNNNWISSFLSSPEYSPIPTDSRSPKPSGEDTYFGDVLATKTTIPHVLTLQRKDILPPAPPPDSTGGAIWPSPTAKPSSAPAVNPADVLVLVDLSAPGICGHPETVHGGVVATLLDEAMSLAVGSHVSTGMAVGVEAGSSTQTGENPRGKIYTAQLDVRYKRPLMVPAVAVIKARVVARQGRKFWVRAQVVQEEKNEQAERHLEWPKRKVVTTDAMAFWVQTKASL